MAILPEPGRLRADYFHPKIHKYNKTTLYNFHTHVPHKIGEVGFERVVAFGGGSSGSRRATRRRVAIDLRRNLLDLHRFPFCHTVVHLHYL